MPRRGTRAPKALGRENRRRGPCGLCGRHRQLSKTHVPPQCAGNRGRIKRFTVVSGRGSYAAPSAKRIGGIHFFGLCSECNSSVQAQWDPAYCEMAKAFWPTATALPVYLPRRLAVPHVEISPGGVARCVVACSFALNPHLRNVHPQLAEQLLNAEEIQLPDDLALFLALTKGPYARVTGSIAGFYLFRPHVDGKSVGVMSMAQIYFPPLAWQLADAELSVLLSQEGWVNVSSWLALGAVERALLTDLILDLPLVAHPIQQPGGRQDWSELLSEKTCFIVESDNAVNSEWADR